MLIRSSCVIGFTPYLVEAVKKLSLPANQMPTGHRRLYNHRVMWVCNWINYLQWRGLKVCIPRETETGQTSLLRRKISPDRPSNRFEKTGNRVLKFSWRSQTMLSDANWPPMKQTKAVDESMAAIDKAADFIDIGMNFLALTPRNKLNWASFWSRMKILHYFSSVAQFGWVLANLGEAQYENSWIIYTLCPLTTSRVAISWKEICIRLSDIPQ